MGRFLMFVSYIGSSFSGMQRQRAGGISKKGIRTVQGTLEEALSSLRPANEVKVVTSSRTDAGVHALCNSVHVDLVHKNPEKEYNPEVITARVNRILHKRNNPLTILQTRRVADDFHTRFRAVARHYLYRIALVKDASTLNWDNPLSALERKRCLMVIPPFDVEKLHESARLFAGTHNFSAFTNPSALKVDYINPVKRVSVGVKPGELFLQNYQLHTNIHTDVWEVHISGHSFLFKQVRRMVGAMIGVAQGRYTLLDLKDRLNNPDKYVENHHSVCHYAAPPHGLYLKDVEYNANELEYTSPGKINYDMDILTLKRMKIDYRGRVRAKHLY